MRETAQRQADGASKAKPRIQPAVRAAGGAGDCKTLPCPWSVAAAGALSRFVRHRR